jgi:hypothetical protein
MGMYATAEIFFGYKWDFDEDEVESDGFEFGDDTWVEYLLDQMGVKDPDYADYPNYGDPEYNAKEIAWREKNADVIKTRDQARQGIRDEFNDCEEGHTGYLADGGGGHTLYVRDTLRSMDWGAKPFDPAELVVTEEAIDSLNRLLDRLGLKPPQDSPQWFLAASYG